MLYYITRSAALSVSVIVAATAATSLRADAPRVVTDIAPVHGIAARLMEGVGAPDLIVPQTASPHGYQLRPSAARALARADLTVWVSDDLTPWMDRTLESLAASSVQLKLAGVEGTHILPIRLELHGGDDHGHGDHGQGDHGHDEHDHDDHDEHKDEHDHGDHDGHDHDDHDNHGEDHADDHTDGHGDHDDHSDDHADDHGHHDHEEGAADPHLWLDPDNAVIWSQAIAAALSEIDPQNAEIYAANAVAFESEVASAAEAATATLSGLEGAGFVVFHDAYQYFETRFGLTVQGSIALSDAVDPSPARLSELRETFAADKVDCVLSEPQFDPKLVAVVAEGAEVKTGVVDPLGSDLPLGGGFYPALIAGLAEGFADCLGE